MNEMLHSCFNSLNISLMILLFIYSSMLIFITYFSWIYIIFISPNTKIYHNSYHLLLGTSWSKIMTSLKQSYNESNANNSKELKTMTINISILTLIALISSLQAKIMSLFIPTNIFYAIDHPLNCLCVMLMMPYYDKLYNILCCGFVKCFRYFDQSQSLETPYGGNKDEEEQEAMTNTCTDDLFCEIGGIHSQQTNHKTDRGGEGTEISANNHHGNQST